VSPQLSAVTHTQDAPDEEHTPGPGRKSRKRKASVLETVSPHSTTNQSASRPKKSKPNRMSSPIQTLVNNSSQKNKAEKNFQDFYDAMKELNDPIEKRSAISCFWYLLDFMSLICENKADIATVIEELMKLKPISKVSYVLSHLWTCEEDLRSDNNNKCSKTFMDLLLNDRYFMVCSVTRLRKQD